MAETSGFQDARMLQQDHFPVRGFRGRPRIAAALSLLAAGGFLWALSAADLLPMRRLAQCFSDDGLLSASYVDLIRSSQAKLAFALLLAGGMFGWVDAERVLRFLRSMAFWKAAALAGALSAGLAYAVQEWLFDGLPHVTDATSHLFQAKIFALGRMHAPVPPCPEAFWQPNVIMTTSGKWFTKYTPGHALLLALGIRTGLLNWVMPMCLAGLIAASGKLLDLFDRRSVARAYMLLLALSPMALLLGGSYMSHISALCAAALGLLCWIRSRDPSGRTGRALRLAAAGFCLSFSAIVRPHEILFIGLMGFLYFLALKGREWLWMLRCLPLLLAGAAPVVAFWLFWNRTLYGDPLAIGYGFTTADVMRPSYQGYFGFSPTFGWREALSVLIWNLERFNRSFLGWPVSLLFVPFAFARRGARHLAAACIGVGVVLGVYFFYDYRAEYEGRYYFLALPFFAYLTVAGMRNVLRLGSEAGGRRFALQAGFLTCLAFTLHGAISYWPDYLVPKYRHAYEDCSPAIGRQVREEGLTRAVVLISPGDSFAYSSGFVVNDPLLRNEVLYARDVPGAEECLRQAYPGRSLYRFGTDPEDWGLRPAVPVRNSEACGPGDSSEP